MQRRLRRQSAADNAARARERVQRDQVQQVIRSRNRYFRTMRRYGHMLPTEVVDLIIALAWPRP